jgi:transcription-repair coupling factor (superfamily II helicase)
MHEDELEEVMRNFIEGNIQVLVSTNIVESGLDIPNANTIIIDHADRFGLADLYQLRGRVGRFKRRAYAYLVYSQDMILNRDARIRLKTIEDFKDLGSGFKVAMRDLEIRGAGNVLGKEQHGHITAIGFGLYCRLLDETIRRLKGQKVQEKYPVSVQLGFDLMIPPSYIGEASLRIEMYHKIFDADSDEDSKRVTQEFIDRFGPLPEEVFLLMEVAQLKVLARYQGLTSIQLHRDRVYFRQGDLIRRVEQIQKITSPKALVIQLRNLLKQETSYDNLKKIRSAKSRSLGISKGRSRFKAG